MIGGRQRRQEKAERRTRAEIRQRDQAAKANDQRRRPPCANSSGWAWRMKLALAWRRNLIVDTCHLSPRGSERTS
jgi:hypothetical protein